MSIINTIVTEHWDDLLAAGIFVGGWLWHKAKGEKVKTVREILDDVVRQVLNSGDINLTNIKARAAYYIREALAKRKVTGKLADALTHEFVEYAAAELAERFSLIQRQLDALAAGAEQVSVTMAGVR